MGMALAEAAAAERTTKFRSFPFPSIIIHSFNFVHPVIIITHHHHHISITFHFHPMNE
jgi:hypothetical protein